MQRIIFLYFYLMIINNKRPFDHNVPYVFIVLLLPKRLTIWLMHCELLTTDMHKNEKSLLIITYFLQSCNWRRRCLISARRILSSRLTSEQEINIDFQIYTFGIFIAFKHRSVILINSTENNISTSSLFRCLPAPCVQE